MNSNSVITTKKIEGTRKIFKGVLYSLMVGWTLFTGTKIFDVTAISAPPDNNWIPYASVIIISGGFIFWVLAAERLAKNNTQKWIAIGLAIVAILSEGILATGDSIFRATALNLVMPEWLKNLVVILPVIEVLIFSGGAAVFIWFDPDIQLILKTNEALGIILDKRNEEAVNLAVTHADNLGQTLAQNELDAALKHRTGLNLPASAADLSGEVIEYLESLAAAKNGQPKK